MPQAGVLRQEYPPPKFALRSTALPPSLTCPPPPSPRTAWARRGLSAHAPPPGQECAGERQLLPLCPFVLVLLPCTVLFCQIRV